MSKHNGSARTMTTKHVRRRKPLPEMKAFIASALKCDQTKAIEMIKKWAAEGPDDDGVTWEQFKANLEANRLGQRKLFRD